MPKPLRKAGKTTVDTEIGLELYRPAPVKIRRKLVQADYPQIYPRGSILRPATKQKPRTMQWKIL
ncbi:hypothetical protein IPU70_10905 [Achromobacter sp. SD115]|uniref:hypothetical protein n=1 Tax=Achromobacter sp. SD115 TaxID=2782011 RepID=UPI001A97248D|nr:hypothetical protein [Achromobacter sp. SD115]MBO1014059.1 hypothetical protein [Achromobacter sp. SD115]